MNSVQPCFLFEFKTSSRAFAMGLGSTLVDGFLARYRSKGSDLDCMGAGNKVAQYFWPASWWSLNMWIRARWFGYSVEEAIGQHIALIVQISSSDNSEPRVTCL